MRILYTSAQHGTEKCKKCIAEWCDVTYQQLPTLAVITVSCRKSFFVLYLAQIHLAADLANTICITPSLFVSVIAFSQPSSYCDWFLFSPNGDPNFSWTILLFFVPFVCDGIWNAFFCFQITNVWKGIKATEERNLRSWLFFPSKSWGKQNHKSNFKRRILWGRDLFES